MTSQQAITGFGLMAFCLGFYFLPFIIALVRSHTNKTAVFMLNMFLGWTLIGWVVALVWSFKNAAEPQTIIIRNGPAAAAAPSTRTAAAPGTRMEPTL